MHNVNWWLMALAFLLGLVLTLFLLIRRVKREVPEYATLGGAGAGAGARPRVRRVWQALRSSKAAAASSRAAPGSSRTNRTARARYA